MTIPGITAKYVFARNPVVLRADRAEETAEGPAAGTLVLRDNAGVVFSGRFSLPLSVNLADVAEAVVRPYPAVPEGNRSALVVLEDAESFGCRQLEAEYTLGEKSEKFRFHILPGGVSMQNYRRYAAEDADAFASRFLNNRANFFLTTRSSAWQLEIPEAELAPLYFLNPGLEPVKVTELCGSNSRTYDGAEAGPVAALDIQALRRDFFMNDGVLPSVFDVYRGGVHSCRVVVTGSAPARESLRVRFLNSLGVPEVIRLEGEVSVNPEFQGIDEADFDRFDTDTATFISDRGRLSVKTTLSVTTRLGDAARARFLCDMLASDEVCLPDLYPAPCKVIPSAEEPGYRHRPETPFEVTVKFAMSETEAAVMEEIASAASGTRPRVFSPRFSEQFN